LEGKTTTWFYPPHNKGCYQCGSDDDQKILRELGDEEIIYARGQESRRKISKGKTVQSQSNHRNKNI
jgi:hypothetical protein